MNSRPNTYSDVKRRKINPTESISPSDFKLTQTSSSASASSSSAASALLPVAIIGGGLGGAALALALQKLNIPFQIYEKDKAFNERKQGYALTMQQGASALKVLGLGDRILNEGVSSLAHVSYTSQGKLLGAYGQVVRDFIQQPDPNNPNNSNNRSAKPSLAQHENRNRNRNVHIPRQRLRELLLEGVNPSNISWDKKLLNFRQINISTDVNNTISDPPSSSSISSISFNPNSPDSPDSPRCSDEVSRVERERETKETLKVANEDKEDMKSEDTQTCSSTERQSSCVEMCFGDGSKEYASILVCTYIYMCCGICVKT